MLAHLQLPDVATAFHATQQAAAIVITEKAPVSIRARKYHDRELAELHRIEKVKVQILDAACLVHDLIDA